MSTRRLSAVLLGIAVTMSAAELVSAAIIWREAYADAQPWFAVVFAGLFACSAALVRRGRTAGAVLCGLLCAFEVATSLTWQRHSVLDWAFQLPAIAVSLAGLVLSITLVAAQRHRV